MKKIIITEYQRQEFSFLCEREYWGSIGAGILPFAKNTTRFLVALRSQDVMEGGTWGIWGGKMDLENGEILPKDAALREFKEETDFNGHIKTIAAYIYNTPDGDFKYYNFIGVLDHEFKPRLNWESDDYKWLTYEELEKLPNKHFGLLALLKKSKHIFEMLVN